MASLRRVPSNQLPGPPLAGEVPPGMQNRAAEDEASVDSRMRATEGEMEGPPQNKPGASRGGGGGAPDVNAKDGGKGGEGTRPAQKEPPMPLPPPDFTDMARSIAEKQQMGGGNELGQGGGGTMASLQALTAMLGSGKPRGPLG